MESYRCRQSADIFVREQERHYCSIHRRRTNCPDREYYVSLSIRGSNSVALKALFSVSSGVFLLVIRKYCCVEETPDYAKTKAFWVLRSFKMSYFCRYKEKNEAMLSLARLFDAVTAKRGLFKTVPGSTLLCLSRKKPIYGNFFKI